MKMEVITPEENMGDIVGDINRRRGQWYGWNGAKTIKADVPLSEMFDITTLRTLSSGSNQLWNFHTTQKRLLIFRSSNQKKQKETLNL
jgi:translation elongation factor EF-G